MKTKPKNRPGQGRKPKIESERRVRLSVRISPKSNEIILMLKKTLGKSAGELIDELVNLDKGR